MSADTILGEKVTRHTQFGKKLGAITLPCVVFKNTIRPHCVLTGDTEAPNELKERTAGGVSSVLVVKGAIR